MKTLLQIIGSFYKHFALSVVLIWLCGYVSLLSVFAAPGDLDATFGSNGKVITTVGTNDDRPRAVVIQTDGKIIAAGATLTASGFDFALVRYNSDGSLDSTFGTNGKVITSIGNGTASDRSYAIALQSDGKIILAGESSGSITQIALARYNNNGTLDLTFGTGGKVLTSIPSFNTAYATDLVLLSDGKIIVVGGVFGTTGGFVTTKYNTNGTLDTSFGSNGIVVTSSNNLTGAESVIIQTDGKIVLGGNANSQTSNFAVVRYNSTGTIDTSFGTAGIVTTNVNPNFSYAEDAVLQTDGKILLTGSSAAGFALVRYNPNGSLDTSFGTGGIVTTTGNNSTIKSAIIQSNGKILVAGSATVNSASGFALARYNPNGSLDSSFGTAGTVYTNIRGGFDGIYDISLQTDGKIVVAGTSERVGVLGAAEDFTVARYLGDQITSRRSPFDYDGDGKTDVSIFRPAPGEWWYLRSSDSGNRAFQFGAGTDKIVPADYTGDGKTDVAFWRPSSGQWFILRSEDSSFYAFPFGANGDTPVPADYDGDGKADAAVFRSSNQTWFIQKSSGGTDILTFGTSGDVPTVSDYDGDGKADIAIYRPSLGQWWIRRSSTGSVFAATFGTATDKAVQGDYTGDGKTDMAFWRPSTGQWFILRSEDFSFFAFPFGASGDVPVAGDYDGDGRFDAGVFRPASSTWFISRSTAGTLIQQFGTSGDLPTPNAFVP